METLFIIALGGYFLVEGVTSDEHYKIFMMILTFIIFSPIILFLVGVKLLQKTSLKEVK